MKIVAIITLCVGAAIPSVAIAMGNPASIFCGEMGGRSVLAKLPNGSAISLCYLPGTKIVEEWTLFRMLDGRKPAPQNDPFR